jgi:hypothetical protein
MTSATNETVDGDDGEAGKNREHNGRDEVARQVHPRTPFSWAA